MKIKSFDKASCRELGEAMADALKATAERFGISIKYAGGAFDPLTFTAKFQIGVVQEDGVVATREMSDFKQLAHAFGLKPTDLGRRFTLRGQSYTVCGLKAGARKLPILGQRADGKIFRLREDDVREAFAQSEAGEKKTRKNAKISDDERAAIAALKGDPETAKRRSARAYDVEFKGTKEGFPFSAWLPLAAIGDLTTWPDPEIASMTDYPDMAMQGDWSGVRDTSHDGIWAIFERHCLPKLQAGAGSVR